MNRHIKRHVNRLLSFILAFSVSVNTLYFNSQAEIATFSTATPSDTADTQVSIVTDSQIEESELPPEPDIANTSIVGNSETNNYDDGTEYIESYFEDNSRSIPQYLLEEEVNIINPYYRTAIAIPAGAEIIAAILASLGIAVTDVQANNIYFDMQTSLRNDSDKSFVEAGVETIAAMEALYAYYHGAFDIDESIDVDANTYEACRVYAKQRLAYGQSSATTGKFNHKIGLDWMAVAAPVAWAHYASESSIDGFSFGANVFDLSEPLLYIKYINLNNPTAYEYYQVRFLASNGYSAPLKAANAMLVDCSSINDTGYNGFNFRLKFMSSVAAASIPYTSVYPQIGIYKYNAEAYSQGKNKYWDKISYDVADNKNIVGYPFGTYFSNSNAGVKTMTEDINFYGLALPGASSFKLKDVYKNGIITYPKTMPIYTNSELETYAQPEMIEGYNVTGVQYGTYVSGQKAFDASQGLTIKYAADLMEKLTGFATNIDATAFEQYINSIISSNTALSPSSPQVRYEQLKYILSSIALSYSVVLSDAVMDDFIDSYYGDYVDGSTAEKYDEADYIMSNFVVINGGSSPNNNNDDNKFKIAKALSVGFFSFLISVGLLDGDVSDYENVIQINDNITVGDSLSNPDNPDNTDNKSILDSLSSIKKSIGDLPNTIVRGVSNEIKSVLSTPLASIESIVKLLPDNIAKVLPNAIFSVFSSPLSLIESAINLLPNNLLEVLTNPLQAIQNVIELLPDKLVSGFALSDLFSGLSTLVGGISDSIASALNLTDLFNGLQTSLGNIPGSFTSLINAIQALPDAISNNITNSTDNSSDENNNSTFNSFIEFLFSTIYIILLLILIFFNCLRLIVAIFNIPSSTILFNDDVLKGLQFTKDLQLPLLGVNLYSLLTGLAFFMCVISIIGLLRRKIDKMHE